MNSEKTCAGCDQPNTERKKFGQHWHKKCLRKYLHGQQKTKRWE